MCVCAPSFITATTRARELRPVISITKGCVINHSKSSSHDPYYCSKMKDSAKIITLNFI